MAPSPRTNASPANVVTISSEVTGSTRKPIQVDAAAPGQGVILKHAPMTAGYRALSFLIQGVPPGGGTVQVLALANGTPLNATGKVEQLKAGGWTKVQVPLHDLGAENAPFDTIEFINNGTAPTPTFFVTDVSLCPDKCS